MKYLQTLVLLLATFCSIGMASAQASETEEPITLSESCSCPQITRCGKTAASCRADCSGRASCDCADPSVLCSAYGPYGRFKNTCKCA